MQVIKFCLAAMLLIALAATLENRPQVVLAIGAPSENYTSPAVPATDTANDEIKPNVNFLLEGPSQLSKGAAPAIKTALSSIPARGNNSLTANDKWYLDIDISAPGWLYIYEYYPQGSSAAGKWITYKWHLKEAGMWKIGPFSAEGGEPPGLHSYRIWYYSGGQWVSDDAGSPVYSTINWQFSSLLQEPRIVTFMAVPSSIHRGEEIQLSWEVLDADALEISAIGRVTNPAGTLKARPDTNTTYLLTARDNDGRTVSRQAHVTVLSPTPADIVTGYARNPVIWIMAAALIAIGVMLFLLVRRWRTEKNAGLPFVLTTPRPPVLLPPQAKAQQDTSMAFLELPNGQQLAIVGDNFEIGRAGLARALEIDELGTISRQHFFITLREGQYFIEDAASSRGTLVNGKDISAIGQATLNDGDIIEPAGAIKMVFHIR